MLAFTVGLASEDTSENAIAEVEMDNGKHTNPVFHGDTIYAESTVLEKRDADRLHGPGKVQIGRQKTRRHRGRRNRAHRFDQAQNSYTAGLTQRGKTKISGKIHDVRIGQRSRFVIPPPRCPNPVTT